MKNIEIKLDTDYIKLGELLKLAKIVSQGSDAKYLIKDGKVKLNGEVVLERGKKVYKDMLVTLNYMREDFSIKII